MPYPWSDYHLGLRDLSVPSIQEESLAPCSLHQAVKKKLVECTYLIRIDHRMNIVPLLHLNSPQYIIYPKLLTPLHGQWRRQRGQQHIRLREILENMRWHSLLRVPLQSFLEKVCIDECAARFLPSQVGFLVVRRWETGNIAGLREGNVICGRHGEEARTSVWGASYML